MNDPLCAFTSPDTKWYDVNVRVLSPGPISGLVFCSPNETRTLSVPGILPFNSSQSCYFHHKYDWIVPSGWSVVPADNTNYDEIQGGIRTFATAVLVTAPSTLASGYNGNYNVTVRTEPAWPWPIESTGEIWVGLPSPVTNISIYQQICGTYLEWWLDPVQWTEYTTYSWTFADPGNPTPFWTTQSVAGPAYVSLYATPY